MIVIPWSLATVLMIEAATPSTVGACEPADNRCKAEMFLSRAKGAATARQRALYLHAAHRSYLALFDKTGDVRHLCAARRTFEQSLAIKDQPESQRASFVAVREDLTSREQKSGAQCKSTAKRPKSEPLMVAAHLPAPNAAEAAPTSARLVGEAVVAAEPKSEVPSAIPLIEPEVSRPETDVLLPVTRRLTPTIAQSETSPAAPPPGRNLVITGSVTLAVGLALTGVAGYTGGRLLQTHRDAMALKSAVDGDATDDQLDQDAELRREYQRLGPTTLALALAGGTTVIVAAVLLGVGGRRMARAASRTALVPVPGGLAFHARF